MDHHAAASESTHEPVIGHRPGGGHPGTTPGTASGTLAGSDPAAPRLGSDDGGRAVGPLSREQILHATDVCLREHGYDKTTIRRIAASLDCAVGSIYRYFDDKRDLLTEVTQGRFRPLAQRLDDGAVRDVETVLSDYAAIATAEPESYRLMFWLASVGAESRDMRARPAVPAVVLEIIDGIARLNGDPAAARTLWATLHGLIMLGHDRAGVLQALTSPALPQPIRPA